MAVDCATYFMRRPGPATMERHTAWPDDVVTGVLYLVLGHTACVLVMPSVRVLPVTGIQHMACQDGGAETLAAALSITAGLSSSLTYHE